MNSGDKKRWIASSRKLDGTESKGTELDIVEGVTEAQMTGRHSWAT